MSGPGTALPRIDGPAKLTGRAAYAADVGAPGLLHGVVVSSTVARGRIAAIDDRAARAVPGVVAVLTHLNRPRTARLSLVYKDQTAPPGRPLQPLRDAEIHFNGQPVALVVAQDLETARHAAGLVEVSYEAAPHETDAERAAVSAYEPPRRRMMIPPPARPRGDVEAALARAAVRIAAEYRVPVSHHNPLETHATTVVCDPDGGLTIHDKTQGVRNVRTWVAWVFGLPSRKVRVLSPYVGGAFGSALRPSYQLFLAVLAARLLRRPVRVALTRQQMFTLGGRPQTRQQVTLAADGDGRLLAIRHQAEAGTSRYEDYQENIVNWSAQLYACASTQYGYRLFKTDVPTPLDMRAPGGAAGVYALECAMDELAAAAGLDPLELRVRNHADRDQANRDRPFTSEGLLDCYRDGAARFGWSRRSPAPRSMREDNELIGWGMASGIWDSNQVPTRARVELTADRLVVSSAGADIGTGTYTIMAQIAGEALGLPPARVEVHLGDSSLPWSIVEGGSMHAASLGSAVAAECARLRAKVARLAARALDDASPEALVFFDGRVALRHDSNRFVTLEEILRQAPGGRLTSEGLTLPGLLDMRRYSRATHSAVFAEVRVDAELGIVRVTRLVGSVAAGRILNPLTARSQVLGGMVWGMSMALHEETLTDHRFGRPMNHNLAEYHVPAHADVPPIEVSFVDQRDDKVNPLGIKGLGEIGVVGTAAAIANALFHATGHRVRDLPITPDKVLAGL
ncbi:xanthine dehydrogenase family protein molybdopterin-binding subunit [Reyranella sp.]|uniref:xanthine dehydrogenase family protein molybdopterin-binding subunit n=1 Tax=Reyranella sp. TaxID=1929291 RepID=UPI003BA8CDA5